MIENPREWLASLLDSPMIAYGTRRDVQCGQCGGPILIGADTSKYCIPCIRERRQAYDRQRRRREVRRCACGAEMEPKRRQFCSMCAKVRREAYWAQRYQQQKKGCAA